MAMSSLISSYKFHFHIEIKSIYPHKPRFVGEQIMNFYLFMGKFTNKFYNFVSI